MKTELSNKMTIARVGRKLTRFSIPLMAWIVIELFILPIDFFTFRVWETLFVRNVKLLSGPFYPGIIIDKVEEGELVPHTEFAVKRKVTWQTDSWGFRNRNADGHQDIVIIGDSFITGVKLDQEEILTEVMSRKLNKKVYSFAPGDANKYLVTKRFQNDPPEIIILCKVERNVITTAPINYYEGKAKIVDDASNIIYNTDVLEKLLVNLDRASKFVLLKFMRSAAQRSNRKLPEHHGDDFFIQGDYSLAKRGVTDESIEKVANIIKSHHQTFKEKNIRFIFMPIPDKETVYYKYFSDEKPDFLPRLIKRCRELGVETVDIHDPFIEANYLHNIRLFFTDDGHWNYAGVKIASDQLVKTIKEKKNLYFVNH
jgi:alginate O-acetyltransferase complex protein AlgJ